MIWTSLNVEEMILVTNT